MQLFTDNVHVHSAAKLQRKFTDMHMWSDEQVYTRERERSIEKKRLFCIQREREDGRKHDLLHPARERRWQRITTKQGSTSQNSHKQMYIAKYTSLCTCIRVCMCVCVHVCIFGTATRLFNTNNNRNKRTCAHGCAGMSIFLSTGLREIFLSKKKVFPTVCATTLRGRRRRCALARQLSAPLFCVRKQRCAWASRPNPAKAEVGRKDLVVEVEKGNYVDVCMGVCV